MAQREQKIALRTLITNSPACSVMTRFFVFGPIFAGKIPV
jgi:hypothetical protein